MTRSGTDLHIVSFDIPYPADYGGVIDIYYKVKALKETGLKIHLHCFEYGRGERSELHEVAHKVSYYQRHTFRNPFYGDLPYIIASRNNPELLTHLQKDHAPILFEGLHTTFFLNHPSLKNRLRIVRTHNIEYDYYKNLEEVESNFFKKYFFRIESEKLREYEKHLSQASVIAAISPKDLEHYRQRFEHTVYLPAFHPNDEVTATAGSSDFALYHGNLGVGENNTAALYLVNEVFSQIRYPLVIAGQNPSKNLRNALKKYPHIELKAHLNTEQIHELIRNAHVNVLPTFQGTGIKLKLLNALHLGRHCVVNSTMVCNTGLQNVAAVCDRPEEMAAEILRVSELPFDEHMIAQRKIALQPFNNLNNARQFAADVLHISPAGKK